MSPHGTKKSLVSVDVLYVDVDYFSIPRFIGRSESPPALSIDGNSSTVEEGKP